MEVINSDIKTKEMENMKMEPRIKILIADESEKFPEHLKEH